ncbi:MAG TPA: hypothetical protein VH419_05720, partial [Nocardioidaceae bacterium]
MGAARRRLVTAVVTAAIVVASAAIPAPATEGRQVPHRWRPAVSQTRVDSKYPQAGDPRVDALHYRLGLRWAPATRTLTGHEALLWRATRTMRTFALDLSPDLRLRSVRLDGHRVVHTRRHHKLHLHARVRRGSVHRLVLVYAGVPHGVRGGPIPGAGAQVTPSGGLWTCQPPYGAFTWYAVNDQPADKAYYDFRLAVPRPLVGVANGRLIDRHRHGRLVRTRWHLDAPASSYLTTLGFGRYMHTSLGRVHGTPVSLWTPRGDAATRRKFRYAAPALRWLEHR